jgi:hypothetical protein
MAEPLNTNQYLSGVLGNNTPAPEGDNRDISVDDIARFQLSDNPEYAALMEEQAALEGAPEGPLAMSTYFPSAANNIVKGGYSGSEVGSISAYAPSTLVPIGMYDAREAALKKAAAKKAASIDQFQKLYGKAPQTKRFAVQAELNDTYYTGLQNWIGNAKATYGSNWATALGTDTKFLKWNEDMRTVARYEDGIVDFLGDLDKREADPMFITSPQAKLAKSQFMAGIGGLSNPTGTPGGKSLAEQILFLKAETDLDYAVNTATKEYVDKAWGSAQYQGAQGPYDVWTQWEKTGMKQSEVDTIAEGIWKNSYGGKSDIFTIDDIKNRIKAIYPERTKAELKTVSNQYSAGAGGADVQYTDDDISGAAAPMNIAIAQGGGAAPRQGTATSYGTVALKKAPVKTVLAKDTNMFDFSTGSPVRGSGAEPFIIGETRVALTQKGPNGEMAIVPDDMYSPAQVKDFISKGYLSYRPVAIGRYERTTAPGLLAGAPQKEANTLAVPLETVENSLVAKRNEKGEVVVGVPVDKQYNLARALNEQSSKGKVIGKDMNVLSDGTVVVFQNGQWVPAQ